VAAVAVKWSLQSFDLSAYKSACLAACRISSREPFMIAVCQLLALFFALVKDKHLY